MSWILRTTIHAEDRDVVIDQLWANGSTGIADESDPSGLIAIVAGFDDKAAATRAAATFPNLSPTVAPDPQTWEGPEPTRHTIGDTEIVIDAGHSFGHGNHPTTALLLAWLRATRLTNRSVLDVGTGSGILAIAACKLGACQVDGIDNDPKAIESAIANSATNGVDFVPTDTSAADLAGPADAGTYDIVLANMLLAHLREVAADLVRLTGSTLLVSGILASHVDETVAILAPLRLAEIRADGDWRALRMEAR